MATNSSPALGSPEPITPHGASPSQAALQKKLNPVLILLLVVAIAVALTYLLDSGAYQREGKSIIPDSYHVIDKSRSPLQLLGVGEVAKGQAQPVSLIDAVVSIPEALEKSAGLIFMVLFIGGMFGVLTRIGAVETGLERMLSLTRGNVYVLVPTMMIIFSFGSTFMGMAKEYLLLIPMVIAMMQRMGLSSLIGLAIVAIPVKMGYLSSITNPYALSVAQPLVGVPVFSGIGMRIFVYAVLMVVGIAFMLWTIHRAEKDTSVTAQWNSAPLPTRHLWVLITLGLGIAFLVYGSQTWHWEEEHLSAYYLTLAVAFAMLGGLSASDTADAFLEGMKKVLAAGVLIALATSVAIILKKGQILDSIVHSLVGLVGGDNPFLASVGMFFSQLLIDIAIPSTSGQAAVTMPILSPVGQLAGVDPHTTVLAFLLGNGLTNMITPTSSGLLIFLATAQVGWGQWARFILPLCLIVALLSMGFLAISLAVYG